ncbi:uncharacterized protein LOC129720522 [Wyeomyia smithii]|uniref:uncharacterized protein LOC129720522 n=1 Tax=Wyeomyia smithii TaxID=174621 RepID=UPI002467B9F1|nr:uncharacterized protein LOC129720522 [Wyeomyia smithii]
MEAPYPIDTVALPTDFHPRHCPGPVFGDGDGVFQPASPGKYNCTSELPVPHAFSRSSALVHESVPRVADMRIYYHNVRGLRTKIDSFFLAVSEGDYDLIVLTETWLDDRIFSAQLFGNRYTVFRNDRSHLNSQKTRGGGVLIAVSVKLSCRIDPAPVFNTVEQLWVIVETANSDISIGVVYIPPDRKSDSQVIQQHIDSIGMVLSRLQLKTPALLFGDYNQSGLRWFISDNGHPSVDTLHSNMPAYCCSLLDGLYWHGLTQVNNILIDNERLLDLVWVNDETLPICSVSAAHEPLVELEAVHPAIVLSLNLSSTIVYDEPSELRALNFRRADYATLTAALAEINWNAVLEPSISIDNAVNSFSSTLESVLAQTVPFFEPPRKPPWSNPRLRTLRRLRSAALRKYCCYRSAYNRNQFTTASCQYRNYNRYLYNRKRVPIEYDYTISSQHLLRVQCVKDLGVYLDSELTFKNHYNNIIAKATRRLGFIFKIADEFRDPLCFNT